MPNVDPVILKLETDLRDYNRDLSRAQALTDTKLDAIEKRGHKMGRAISGSFSLAKTAAIGFVASVGVNAIRDAVTAGLDYASALGEQAQQLGVTTDALQEYRYAASQAGLSSEEMDMALGQLTRRIGEAASGTKAQAEAFAKLGVSVKDAKGNIIDAGSAIPQIADALQRIESPAERAAILMDLFGRAGQKLEPLLSGGSTAVNNLRDAAHKLGIVLSEDQIQKADETADKLSALKQVLEAKIAGAVSDNADSILELVTALTSLVTKLGQAAKAWREFQNSQVGQFIVNPEAAGARVRQAIVDGSRVRGGAPTAQVTPQKRGFGATIRGMFTPQAGPRNTNLGGAGLTTPGRGPSLRDFGSGGVDTSSVFEPVITSAVKLSAELERMAADLDTARADLTGNLQDRAAAEKRRIDADLAADLERLNSDKDLTKVEREKRDVGLREIAAVRKQIVDKELEADVARQNREAEEERHSAKLEALDLEQQALSAEADAAATTGERLDLERRLLALQQEEERARLEAAIAAGEIADAAGARAKLERKQAADQRAFAKSNEGPGARYLRDLRDEASQLGEAYEEVAVRGLERVNDQLADTVKSALGLHGALGDIVGDLIQIAIRQALIKPLAEGLFGGSSGSSGGGIFGLLTTVASAFGGGSGGSKTANFGKAGGGPVAPGQFYRVNENATPGRVEGFMSRDGGQIIPLGQMDALRSGGGGGGTVRIVIEEAPGFASRVETIATGVSVEVTRQTAPAIIDAATNNTLAKAGRPRL